MVGGHGAVETHVKTTSHEAPSAHADAVEHSEGFFCEVEISAAGEHKLVALK
jgi:hypothetical protein